jgi:hypothetical protein
MGGGATSTAARGCGRIEAAIPSLEHTVLVPSGWDGLLGEPANVSFERVPFESPRWPNATRNPGPSG